MVIEWIAISVGVIPYVKKYAANRADKLADSVLAKTYRRLVPDEKLIKANQTFVSRFDKELDSAIDLATLTAQPYQEALEVFLSSPSVQDALQAPLDGHSNLDWELLRGIWAELRLISLPSDFEWARVSRTYQQSLRNQMIADSELRPVIQALAAVRAAEAGERGAAALDRLVGPPCPFDLSRYADALKRAYFHLRLGALDPDWPHYERRLRLEAVYVPQSAKQALPPRDLTRDYLRSVRASQASRELEKADDRLPIRKEEYAELHTRAIMDIVDDPASHWLVILGDPGLGKSTLLRSLALRWADNPSRPLALVIELRRACGEVGDKSLLSYLEKGSSEICCLPELELAGYLKEQESLVLLDGLDEVPEPLRDNIVSKIIRVAGDYPRARLIVTTRIHGYYPGSNHPDQFRDAGFQQFTLQDFEDSEIDRFVQLWHREAFLDPDERTRYESRLRGAIADSPAIHELASNPLLLTMMAILSRTQDLPRDRSRLYERCAELLLKNWDLEKFPELRARTGIRDIKDKLGPDQKMRILERVAHAMQDEHEGLARNLIAEGKLKDVVEAELALLEVAQPWAVAEDLIWMLRERNFMLAYLGDRQYAFIHRTFLEYFCAKNLKHRLEKTSGFGLSDLLGIFRQRWRDDAWKEVLRLLCGLVGVEYAQDCILELLAFEKESDGQEAGLLAAQCLQEIRETGQIRSVRNQVREVLLLLTKFDVPYFYEPWEQPESKYVAEVRARAVHELARGWRDHPETGPWLRAVLEKAPRHRGMRWGSRWQTDQNEGLRVAAVRELPRYWKGDCNTLPLLKELAGGDEGPEVRAAAIEEVARGWADDAQTLPWLKREAKNVYYRGRETAVREVARGWAKSPATVTWLRTCAEGSEAVVRSTALSELVRGWKDLPDVLDLLKRHMVVDGAHSVRAAALHELVRGWKTDPDVLPLLKERALHDEDDDIRSAAVEAYARGWKDEPETLPWMKRRALDDLAGPVRARALRGVSRLWNGRSETLSWLKERACDDPAKEVRIAALQEVARGWKDEPETLFWLKSRVLNDTHPDVRIAAVEDLVRGWKDGSDTLLWLTERAALDPASEVRVDTVHAIAYGWENDPAALVWLKDCARNNKSGGARAAAVRELACRWREDPETHPLLLTYAGDVDGEVRVEALRELARDYGDDRTVATLLRGQLTQDGDPKVREAALNELVRNGDNSPDILRILLKCIDDDKSGNVRELALIELLNRIEEGSDPDIYALLNELLEYDDSPLVRRVAIEALSSQLYGPPALPAAIERSLHDTDPEVRRSALFLLEDESEDDFAVLSVLKEYAVQDESEAVRSSAIWALKRRTDDDQVRRLLINRATTDESEGVRERAVQVLASRCKEQPEARSLLRDRATYDKSPGVRQAAVWELARRWRGDPDIEQFLSEVLKPK